MKNNMISVDVNGFKYPIANSLLLKQLLPELINTKFSSLEALKRNMITFLDLNKEFCELKRQNLKGSKRARLTREINKTNDQKDQWNEIKDKKAFLKKYYDYILSIYNLSPLNGFGFSNSHGDKMMGNSERQRISVKNKD